MIFVFTLSHDQSQVERGFNISDDILKRERYNRKREAAKIRSNRKQNT